MDASILGWIGLIGLVIAWLYEAYITLKTKKVNIKRGFNILYIICSGSLTLYSWFIGDAIFIMLNGLATISACITLIVGLKYS